MHGASNHTYPNCAPPCHLQVFAASCGHVSRCCSGSKVLRSRHFRSNTNHLPSLRSFINSAITRPHSAASSDSQILVMQLRRRLSGVSRKELQRYPSSASATSVSLLMLIMARAPSVTASSNSPVPLPLAETNSFSISWMWSGSVASRSKRRPVA